MVAAADLRETGPCPPAARCATAGMGTVALECELEVAADRGLGTRPPGFARQPQQLDDGVAQRPDRRHPLAVVGGAHRERLLEPVAIVGQVELAGAARDRAAMLDRVEELRVAQLLHEQRAGRVQLDAQSLAGS